MSNIILRRLKNLDKERMKKHLDIIAKESGKSKLYICTDILLNVITRGIGYTDYFRGNYINLSKKEKDTYVTVKTFDKIVNYLNNPKYVVILNDKLVFNKYFKEYLQREYIDMHITSKEEFKKFLKGKEIVFCKRPIGEGGHDVKKVTIKEHNIDELYEELINDGFYLIEEAVKQSKSLNELNPNVVNTLRILTLYKDGKVHIIQNALRINQDETSVIGCTNDLYCSVGENGYIDSNVIDDYGNIYTHHTLTNAELNKIYVGDVKKANEMVKKAALSLPQERYIGWDVAFTDEGPLLIEGNEYPGYGLLQFYKLKGKKTGHLKDLKDILGDELDKIL